MGYVVASRHVARKINHPTFHRRVPYVYGWREGLRRDMHPINRTYTFSTFHSHSMVGPGLGENWEILYTQDPKGQTGIYKESHLFF